MVALTSTLSSVGPTVAQDMEGTGTEHLSNLSANASGLDGNDSEDYIDFFGWETEPYLEAIVVPVVFGFIFVVGLIGNGTLIFTVAMNKVMRNVPNILIVSLSLGDFLLILISVPLNSTVYTFTSWPYGEVLCKFNFFMQTWSLGITVFTLTALSIDRYLAIITLVFNRTRKEACYNLPEEFDFDAIDKTVPKIYYMTRFIVFFAIPVVVITCFYLLMAQILIRSGEQMPCEGKGGGMNQQRQIAARKKVARIVLSFVFIFVVCWLPRHIYLLWWYFDEEGYFNEFWHVFKILGFCLTFINSCVNPFALYFLSSQFRKYYNRYLFCCFKKLRYTRMEPSSTMQNFNSTVRRASSTNTSM
ncbi:hypothetical protein BaRGS_00014392, partial [Batillaria attramentaria]